MTNRVDQPKPIWLTYQSSLSCGTVSDFGHPTTLMNCKENDKKGKNSNHIALWTPLHIYIYIFIKSIIFWGWSLEEFHAYSILSPNSIIMCDHFFLLYYKHVWFVKSNENVIWQLIQEKKNLWRVQKNKHNFILVTNYTSYFYICHFKPHPFINMPNKNQHMISNSQMFHKFQVFSIIIKIWSSNWNI